ncbi:Uncharacterised protein [Chlamydia trachomatis]|nr:Uncharacterised protein [Chlamydia trachomatis]
MFRIKILDFLTENTSLDDLTSLYKATKDLTESPTDETIDNLMILIHFLFVNTMMKNTKSSLKIEENKRK